MQLDNSYQLLAQMTDYKDSPSCKEKQQCSLTEAKDAFREGANKQVMSSQADSLIKISRIWADFFPQTHRISLFRLFFHHFWCYFRFLLRSLPLTYHLVHPKQVGQGE